MQFKYKSRKSICRAYFKCFFVLFFVDFIVNGEVVGNPKLTAGPYLDVKSFLWVFNLWHDDGFASKWSFLSVRLGYGISLSVYDRRPNARLQLQYASEKLNLFNDFDGKNIRRMMVYALNRIEIEVNDGEEWSIGMPKNWIDVKPVYRTYLWLFERQK